ncbi:MAG: nuclear transport factor 2 family protein [Pseudomonadota bacterium]
MAGESKGSLVITEQEAAGWLQDYGRAWETADAELIVSLFTRDASYRETPFDAAMIGHDAIKRYWIDQPSNHQDVRFSFEILAVVGNQCFSHWNTKFSKGGRKLELDGAFRLIFERQPDGPLLCRTLEEWWHQREAAG